MSVYDDLASVAAALLGPSEFGRPVTILRFAAGTPTDPTKPWRPGAPVKTTFSTTAVVDQRVSQKTGVMTETVYLPAKGLPFTPLGTDIVHLNGQDRGIETIEPIQPGDVGILFKITLLAPAALALP